MSRCLFVCEVECKSPIKVIVEGESDTLPTVVQNPPGEAWFLMWRRGFNIHCLENCCKFCFPSTDIFLKVPESYVGTTQNTSKIVRDHQCQQNKGKNTLQRPSKMDTCISWMDAKSSPSNLALEQIHASTYWLMVIYFLILGGWAWAWPVPPPLILPASFANL